MMQVEIQRPGVRLGGRSVLKPLQLALPEGELVGFIGPNGAGKSTLMRLMAGLLPESPGAVSFGMRPLSELSAPDRARSIAWLSQARELSWDLMSEDVVALGRHAWGGGRYDRLGEADRAIVDAAFEKAGAAHLKARHVLSLSGGEQARVHLARLFAVEARVLLLDEPLAALDIAQQLSVMAALTGECRDGRLVCLALHDLSLAADWCSRLIVLKEGELVADGAPGDALSPDVLRDVFGVRRAGEGQFAPV